MILTSYSQGAFWEISQMKHDLHGGVTFRLHSQSHVEGQFIRISRPGRETSFILNLHGFRIVPPGEMDFGDDCQIGGPSMALQVRDVETGFAHGE